jgi:hypothetical protein
VHVYETTRPSAIALVSPIDASLGHFGSGFIAGLSASLISCPMELVRNQRIIHDVRMERGSSWGYTRTLIRNHGVLGGLYRGYHLHGARESLGTGIYWLSYESLHRLPWINPHQTRQDASATSHFVAGGLTGMVAWAVIFPLDLVKNVYQKDASVRTRDTPGRSVVEVVKRIYARQGIRGFYNGCLATMCVLLRCWG